MCTDDIPSYKAMLLYLSYGMMTLFFLIVLWFTTCRNCQVKLKVFRVTSSVALSHWLTQSPGLLQIMTISLRSSWTEDSLSNRHRGGFLAHHTQRMRQGLYMFHIRPVAKLYPLEQSSDISVGMDDSKDDSATKIGQNSDISVTDVCPYSNEQDRS